MNCFTEPKYIRMSELATSGDRKPYTYKTRDGKTRTRRGREARQGRLPLGESTIWEMVRKKEFPEPIKLGQRVTAWLIEDIEKWEHSKTNLTLN